MNTAGTDAAVSGVFLRTLSNLFWIALAVFVLFLLAILVRGLSEALWNSEIPIPLPNDNWEAAKAIFKFTMDLFWRGAAALDRGDWFSNTFFAVVQIGLVGVAVSHYGFLSGQNTIRSKVMVAVGTQLKSAQEAVKALDTEVSKYVEGSPEAIEAHKSLSENTEKQPQRTILLSAAVSACNKFEATAKIYDGNLKDLQIFSNIAEIAEQADSLIEDFEIVASKRLLKTYLEEYAKAKNRILFFDTIKLIIN